MFTSSVLLEQSTSAIYEALRKMNDNAAASMQVFSIHNSLDFFHSIQLVSMHACEFNFPMLFHSSNNAMPKARISLKVKKKRSEDDERKKKNHFFYFFPTNKKNQARGPKK